MSILNTFIFWFPLVMSLVWISGSILFHQKEQKSPPVLENHPMVSILVPCFNEQSVIEETIQKLDVLNYPNYEIIAINDGSSDKTEYILDRLAENYERLKVIQLKENSGKANALYLGLIASKGEFLVSVDADSYLDEDALNYMIPHFITPKYGERVGAVTGNPRVRNRNSLLAKIQLCEYSSIISSIKRTQRMLGKVMTVSGVVVAFRKKALLDCGLWDRDLITEDIGVTWKLQKRFWDIRYESRALCWMLVPETLKGLWDQRVRWAQGGLEVMFRHWGIIFDWKYRRLVPILFEEMLSLAWVIAWMSSTFIFIFQWINQDISIWFSWQGQFLSVICLIQFFVAMTFDKKHDKSLMKYYLWAIWYPVLYWNLSALIIIRAIPKAIISSRKKEFATWSSPDRGLSETTYD